LAVAQKHANEPKYIVTNKVARLGFLLLIIGIAGVVPLSSKLRESPKASEWLWLAIGFGLFLYPAIPQFGIMIRGDASWTGHTKGFEISVVDLAVWAYLVAIRGVPKTGKLPFTFGMKLFFATVLFASFLMSRGSIGLYYCFQLFRMYLLFRAVGHAAQNENLFKKLMDGLSYGIILEIVFVLYQKFVLHTPQPSGTYGHQNILGLTNNMLLVTLITPLFGHKGSKLRYAAILSSVLIPALIASRATAVLGLFAIAVSYVLSLQRQATPQKLKFGMLGLLAVLVLVPVALASVQGRFKGDNYDVLSEKEGYDEREAYKKAAWLMIADHPAGVGPNYFVTIGNSDGYYVAGGVQPVLASRMGSVHNIFMITTAEDGWLGLAALVVMFSVPLFKGYMGSRKLRGTIDGELVGGITVALVFCYLHSTYEWMLVLADPEYMLALVMGLLAALLVKNRKKIAGNALQMAVDENRKRGQVANRIGF
jgi:O-antigen ligase